MVVLMPQFRLYIEFRNADMTKEVYRSPVFDAPGDLLDEDSKIGQAFDELVVDGDDKTGFCVSCDMQCSGNNIVWNMFEPFDKTWIKDLAKVWKRKLKFELPKWADWDRIDSVDEAHA